MNRIIVPIIGPFIILSRVTYFSQCMLSHSFLTLSVPSLSQELPANSPLSKGQYQRKVPLKYTHYQLITMKALLPSNMLYQVLTACFTYKARNVCTMPQLFCVLKYVSLCVTFSVTFSATLSLGKLYSFTL